MLSYGSLTDRRYGIPGTPSVRPPEVERAAGSELREREGPCGDGLGGERIEIPAVRHLPGDDAAHVELEPHVVDHVETAPVPNHPQPAAVRVAVDAEDARPRRESDGKAERAALAADANAAARS